MNMADDIIFCRVCEKKIGRFGWSSHVMAHKKQYCKDNGIPEYRAHEISWERVVRHYNPDKARSTKQVGLFDTEKLKDLNFWMSEE